MTLNNAFTQRHADNSGNHADLRLKIWHRTNGSTLLKIPSQNNTWSAFHKHEWSDKKVGWSHRKRQMYKCHEPLKSCGLVNPILHNIIQPRNLPVSKYSKHFTWNGFKLNNGNLQRLKTDPSPLSTDSFSPIFILAFLIMQTSLIYNTQDFRV